MYLTNKILSFFGWLSHGQSCFTPIFIITAKTLNTVQNCNMSYHFHNLEIYALMIFILYFENTFGPGKVRLTLAILK